MVIPVEFDLTIDEVRIDGEPAGPDHYEYLIEDLEKWIEVHYLYEKYGEEDIEVDVTVETD